MPVVSNLINDQTNSLLTSCGSWVFIDSEPHIKTHTSEFGKFTGKGSIRVEAGSSNPIRIETGQFSVDEQFGWDSRAFFWLYSSEPVTVTAAVTTYAPTAASASATLSVFPGKWNLISVDGTTATEGSSIQMGMAVSGLIAGQSFYATNPVIFAPNAISKNIFAAETWLRLPEYMREADATTSSPDFSLLRFIDVITASADDVYSLWDEYRYIPPEEGDVHVSLLEPEVASIEMLRWWATFLGITFYDPSTGTTPWINFMQGLDPDGIPEWEDWMSVLDVNMDTVVTWDEVQNFAPATTGLLDLLRWQVRTAYYGIRGGTKEAIVESTKKLLSGTQYVNFTTHDGGDPWLFRIQTKQAETPGTPTIGTSSQSVIEMVTNAIPAGYDVVHETIA